jgi:hypothetical protein
MLGLITTLALALQSQKAMNAERYWSLSRTAPSSCTAVARADNGEFVLLGLNGRVSFGVAGNALPHDAKTIELRVGDRRQTLPAQRVGALIGEEARRAFILENTRVQAPPHTPELSLHLADEITPIWKLTEEALERSACRRRSGPSPGPAARPWRATSSTIPEIVAGKRVIDFATGSGLVGIAAMKAGAASVLAADIDASARRRSA